MITELIVAGGFVGFFSGFFGIGGGTILVPMLVFLNFKLKEAISISIMQMVFSSLYGSFLNIKQNRSILKDGIFLGIGGSIGGMLSGFIVPWANPKYLHILFLGIVLMSIYKVFQSKESNTAKENKEHPKYKLLIIGSIIGIIAMSVGVGGSIMLTPALVSYLKYDIKHAASLGLFFVVFSSLAGFISFSYNDMMMYFEGSIIGVASLIGVYFGNKAKQNIKSTSYKGIILTLYIVIFFIMLFDYLIK